MIQPEPFVVQSQGWPMAYTTTAYCYAPQMIQHLKDQTPFVRQVPYRETSYQKPFEPVIHTGNEKMLIWQPYVFTGLLCTEVILGAYWILHHIGLWVK